MSPFDPTELDIREAYQAYTNPMGLVDNHPKDDSNSGNCILYHAHYLWVLCQWGILREVDQVIAYGVIQRALQIEPGLYRRAEPGRPYCNDQIGPDDLIALASMSLIGPEAHSFAKDLLQYGRQKPVSLAPWWLKWIKFHYVYNNVMPGTLLKNEGTELNFSAWLGRQPQLIAHFQFCAREKFPTWRITLAAILLVYLLLQAHFWGSWNFLVVPAALVLLPSLAFGFRRLCWALSLWSTARFKDQKGQDPWILSWYLANAYLRSGEKSAVCEWAGKNFLKRLDERAPHGLSDIFAEYWGKENPTSRYFLELPLKTYGGP